jgi:hypothetical protein
MQQTAFLEPRDLIVWVHRAPFLQGLSRAINAEGPEKETVRAERALLDIAALAFEKGQRPFDELASIMAEFGAPSIRWLLTLWHEQRHFVDHFFTNYGASQFRIAFLMRSQIDSLFKASVVNDTVAFPLDTYSDPIRLRALGIKTEGPHVLAPLGRFLAERRSLLAQDRQAGLELGGNIQLDGYALLEALGSLAQLNMMGRALGGVGYRHWRELGSAYTRFRYIEGVASCLAGAGISSFLHVHPVGHDTAVGINDAILTPVLIACLMCRRTAQPARNTGQLDQSAFLPAFRLHRLIDAIKTTKRKDITRIEDGFRFINELCRQVWGRTIYDDLNEDIDFTENEFIKFESAFGKDNPDIGFMRTYIAARRRLQREFESTPIALCGGAEYYNHIVPNVKPKLVFVDAAADGPMIIAGREGFEGQVLTLSDGPNGRIRPLVCCSHGNEVMSVHKIYCFDRMDIDEGRVFDVHVEDLHWRRGVAMSPWLSLLFDGRTQVSGRDFTIYLTEKNFREAGVNVVYDQGYEKPAIERNPDYLFEMLGLSSLVCDLSGTKVTRDSCVLVSPWDLKVHAELREAAKRFGKEDLCPLLVDDDRAPLGDWNVWIVRKDLASCLFV